MKKFDFCSLDRKCEDCPSFATCSFIYEALDLKHRKKEAKSHE
jgi:hypothetical protein